MSIEESSRASLPREIEMDRTHHLVRIAWADDARSEYDWEWLRWRCPCAWCSGEGGQPGALARRTSLEPDEAEMVDLTLVGRYAVQPTWKDGHDTGIYTFRQLRSLAEENRLVQPAPGSTRDEEPRNS